MRIAFHKQSEQQHVLEITRDDGRSEQMTCETRSYLLHDLLHYAVESEAELDQGLWGRLAAGHTLRELREQAQSPAQADSQLPMIETLVGAMTGAAKGGRPEVMIDNLRANADSLDWPIPQWLTAAFVRAVQERMRQLVGHYRSTPFGERMELRWPAPGARSAT